MELYFTIGGVFLLGLVTMFVLMKFGVRGWKSFVSKTKLIKDYWVFVIIFSIVVTAAYWIGLTNAAITDKNLFVSIVNHVSALIFAIFTGYFAFSQVMESRFEKFNKEAYDYLSKQDYTMAIKSWENAAGIRRKDAVTLANLLEVNLLTGNYEKVAEKLHFLERISPPERKELAPSIKVCMHLFKEHIAEAKEAIKEVIDITEAKKINKYGRWGFKDIQDSPRYKELKGDSKKMLDNYVTYITGRMNDDEKTKFINGNYLG